MSLHLQHEIEKLKKLILCLSAMVEDQVWQAVKSVETHDTSLAQAVMERDLEIDRNEIDVEEECLKILALYQPVAVDLRFIVAVLKINNDLERIGDLAFNIAERTVYLAEHKIVDAQYSFEAMAEKVQSMLRQSLDALVNLDAEIAQAVMDADDEVDAMDSDLFEQISRQVNIDPENIVTYIHLLSISRHLERIADLATNIAEDVIYMVKGTIVRHGKK